MIHIVLGLCDLGENLWVLERESKRFLSYTDTSTTHHLTSDLANLNVHPEEYPGSDQIRVGNGKSLPVAHIGKTKLTTPHSSFLLNNVLHFPQITKKIFFQSKIHFRYLYIFLISSCLFLTQGSAHQDTSAPRIG